VWGFQITFRNFIASLASILLCTSTWLLRPSKFCFYQVWFFSSCNGLKGHYFLKSVFIRAFSVSSVQLLKTHSKISLRFPLGAYIYIEASEPQRHRHVALLMGPRLCGRMCLQFFYNMNGRRVGTLNVYKREGMRSDDLLWTMSGEQGTDWHEALVDIGGACYQVLWIISQIVMSFICLVPFPQHLCNISYTGTHCTQSRGSW